MSYTSMGFIHKDVWTRVDDMSATTTYTRLRHEFPFNDLKVHIVEDKTYTLFNTEDGVIRRDGLHTFSIRIFDDYDTYTAEYQVFAGESGDKYLFIGNGGFTRNSYGLAEHIPFDVGAILAHHFSEDGQAEARRQTMEFVLRDTRSLRDVIAMNDEYCKFLAVGGE
jgi:hypothetical protein